MSAASAASSRPNPPANFKYVFSCGGKEDVLIDPTRDRDADVFLTLEDLEAAGYSSQAASDLLAVHGPPRVGMTVNRHGKGMTASFGELQRQQDAEAADRRERQQAKAAPPADRTAPPPPGPPRAVTTAGADPLRFPQPAPDRRRAGCPDSTTRGQRRQ